MNEDEGHTAHLCAQCGVEVFTNDSGETWWDGATGLTNCPTGPRPEHNNPRAVREWVREPPC